MNTLGWVALIVIGAIASVAYVQHRRNRGSYRPLSQRQPTLRTKDTSAREIGTEAIDMESFKSATRRNEALEASRAKWLSCNETPAIGKDYTTWFHNSFHKRNPKDKI